MFLYSFIDCTGVGKQGCKCPEGFNCKAGKCQPAPGKNVQKKSRLNPKIMYS